MNSNYKIALLIDCDNVSHQSIEGVLQELAKNGAGNVRHAHGNWNGPQLGGWIEKLHANAIRPVQQFAYTTGKNATDASMIIDAMDLLYSADLGGFCIVSSDSDFTRLAARLRESGKVVYGFGEQKTPKPFVAACDRFIYTEIFTQHPENAETVIQRRSAQELRQDTKLCNLLRQAIEAASDDEGWANLGPVGSQLAKQMPEFDPRNYGYSKFSGLVEGIGLFTLRRENNLLLVKDQRPGKKG